jgi:hypothetical protein
MVLTSFLIWHTFLVWWLLELFPVHLNIVTLWAPLRTRHFVGLVLPSYSSGRVGFCDLQSNAGSVCVVSVNLSLFEELTLSNPIFLPIAYSPAFICFGRERGWWITCNYPTVLKEKTWRNRKSTTCAICWLKSVHEEKRRTGSDSGRTVTTKTVSDVFRHRSGTGIRHPQHTQTCSTLPR